MVPRDWNACTLDKIFQLGSGDTKPADLSGERTPNTPYPVYGGNDVMGYSSLYNSTSEVIVIGRVGEKCGVTRLVSETCWITDNALYTKSFISETNKTFLTYRLQYQDLSRLRNKGSQPLVSQKPIYALEIAFPPIAEQTKIAQILSTWDKAIATTERLLANSQQQKDMLTNQLLTGQQRFSEFVTSKDYQQTFHGPIPRDWSYVPIADIANQQSKANSTQADLPVLSCSKYDGLVDSLKYFKKKVYSDDTSKYRVVEFGDFAYPSNHIEEGSIGYQDVYPAGIVSPIYTVFRTTDAVDDYFLYRTLKTDKYRQIFSAATSASVDRRGSLRWKEFSKIQVPLPPLPEQQKIAQVLSTADAEITNLQAQLAKLKLEKKALMQQLLTGQRRVKLDADAAA